MLWGWRKRTGFQDWHDTKASSWRFSNPLFVAIGTPIHRLAFYIPNCLSQPTPFPLHPSFHNVSDTFVWCETHHMRSEGKKNSLSKKENRRGILNSAIYDMFYTCTYCTKLLPHLLLLFLWLCFTLLPSILGSVISSISSVDDLPDLT